MVIMKTLLLQRLAVVVVLMLMLFGECVISQRVGNSNDSVANQQTQQEQQQTNASDTKQQQTRTTTTSNTTKSTTTTPAPSKPDANAASTNVTNSSRSQPRGTFTSSETNDSSKELLLESEDAIENSNITATTYRPGRPSIAPQTSAQERERRLMNVLAARRNALHRGNFRTRVGTTGRTATSTAVETTSKAPTDPRSVCIRNCTKNFTRRTTASCMRQCANFTTTAPTTANSSTPRPSKRQSTNQTGERDTNEILFTDESSHGLFVVAKDQNDTVNHIPDSAKFRGRGKHVQTATIATTSVEEDEMQPYLFFGQKLPPLKHQPLLTITSVSDEHPKLLEVSVSRLASTTPATAVSTSTLSAVERSRSRFKYNMRERGTSNFNRRFSGSERPPTLPADGSIELRFGAPNSTTEKPKDLIAVMIDGRKTPTLREAMQQQMAVGKLVSTSATPTASSTPLIITVLGDDEPQATIAPDSAPVSLSTTTKSSVYNRSKPNTTTSVASTTTTSTTTTTTTTTEVPPISTAATSTEATSTRIVDKNTHENVTTGAAFSTPSFSTTTTAPKTTPKRKSIIEEDTERLRAMGPSLTQHVNIDEKTNLIIFINHTSRPMATANTSTTTMLPLPADSNSHTTDASSTILRTTVLSSVRSTVNPRTSSTPSPLSESANNPATYIGIVESMPAEETTARQTTGGAISSTVVTDEHDVSIEMRRMNIATMVLAGIGIFPLLALLLYVVRSFLAHRKAKHDEDFDVCITDQQPISPVKKLDSKYHNEEESDDVDQRGHHTATQATSKIQARDANHNHHYDEVSSMVSEQEFDRTNIRLKSLLGEGNFGQVWKAEADDLSGHFGATRIVAVKTIRANSAQAGLKEEANIMRKLGSHPNVVTMLGACVETEPHMLIMEYAMRGRLLSLLRAARSATHILPASVPGGRSLTPLSPRTLAGFALDVACGMEYIAGKRIVHRDLAARNILLDHNGVCKICDFGMSIDLEAERRKNVRDKNAANEAQHTHASKLKFDFGGRFIMNHWNNSFGGNQSASNHQQKEAGEKKSHGHGHGHDTIGKRPALPIRWMAPEALQYHVFTTETDVWAFGIVLWEIATLGATPYSQHTGREVIRRVPNGLRPELPKEGRHEFYNLMAHCWHKEPQLRPNFTQARQEITRSLHKWVDDDSASSDYMDVSGFSEDLEHGMVYFNHRISEFECDI